MSTASDGGQDDPRRLAILIDRIGALSAAPAAHVLAPMYSALFTDAQIELADRPRSVWALVESGRLDAVTTAAVRKALAQIGDLDHERGSATGGSGARPTSARPSSPSGT